MKIGLVRRGYSQTGGAEHYLKRLAKALTGAGHECVLFASRDWPQTDWAHGGIRVVPGDSPRGFADALEAMQPRKACDFLFSMERVWNCDCYRAGDGVHRAWLERRTRYEPKWRGWFRQWKRKHRELLALEAGLLKPGATRAIIANSQIVKEEIIRFFGYPADQIHVVYNGVPNQPGESLEELRTETRRQMGMTQRDYVMLFAGSGWERKGLRFAIDGINQANLSQPTLLVAGRGSQLSFPQSSRVRFLGPVTEMKPLFAAADVFVLPTIYDPFSNACLEALAAGLPVITTRANGFSEIIESGVEGEILSEPSDSAAIARAIEKWSPPGKRAAIKPRLQALAAQFDIETSMKQTLAVFDQLK